MPLSTARSPNLSRILLLRAVGARVPFGRTVYLYFVGAFFNTFLPTGFGGDVVRVLEIGEGASSQQAAGTTVVDRLTGFIVLFLLALAVLPFSAHLLSTEVALLIVVLTAGVVAGSALLFEGRLLRRLIVRVASLRWLRRHSRLNQAYRAALGWVEHTYGVITACGARALAGAMFWSLVFNLLQIAANVLVGQALGLRVSDRTAVVLYYWYDFCYEEIAATLRMTVSAVKSRLHRARLSMAQHWKETESKAMLVERKHYESPTF